MDNNSPGRAVSSSEQLHRPTTRGGEYEVAFPGNPEGVILPVNNGTNNASNGNKTGPKTKTKKLSETEKRLTNR